MPAARLIRAAVLLLPQSGLRTASGGGHRPLAGHEKSDRANWFLDDLCAKPAQAMH